MKTIATSHALRRIKARMGSGFVADKKIDAIWESHDGPPPEWNVPHVPGKHYRKYKSFLFVFARGSQGDMMLTTVVGPFLPGDTWVSKGE